MIKYTPNVQRIDRMFNLVYNHGSFTEADMNSLIDWLGIQLSSVLCCVEQTERDEVMEDHFIRVRNCVRDAIKPQDAGQRIH